MNNYFIMTVRNKYMNRQAKFTIENGRYVKRVFELYPNQHILHEMVEYSEEEFKFVVRSEIMFNLVAESGANIYFNGDNFRKFLNEW